MQMTTMSAATEYVSPVPDGAAVLEFRAFDEHGVDDAFPQDRPWGSEEIKFEIDRLDGPLAVLDRSEIADVGHRLALPGFEECILFLVGQVCGIDAGEPARCRCPSSPNSLGVIAIWCGPRLPRIVIFSMLEASRSSSAWVTMSLPSNSSRVLARIRGDIEGDIAHADHDRMPAG